MQGKRLGEIDGLRGWAALSVVVFHLFQESFGNIHPEWMLAEIKPFMDGPLAVFVFFILSGDALSTRYVSGGSLRSLDRIIAKRYFRLSIPMLLTVIPTWALMACGFIYSPQAGVMVKMGDWLGSFLHFPASLWDAFKFSLAGVYGWVPVVGNWNTFLWTMPVELGGSMLVFLYLLIINRLRYPVVTTLFFVVCGSMFSAYFELFFVGIFLAQLRALRVLDRVGRSIYGWVGGLYLLLAAYLLEVISFSVEPGRALIPPPIDAFLRAHQHPWIAVMIVVGTYISVPALSFFRSRVSTFLGRLSFGIYLIQFPVLCSFESYMIMTNPKQLGSLPFALGVAGASLLLTIGIADVFSRIDDYVLRRVDTLLRQLFKVEGQDARSSGSQQRQPEAKGPQSTAYTQTVIAEIER